VVSPVGRFGYRGRDHKVGTGEAGPVAHHLFRCLTDIQYGRAPDPYGWTRKVEVAVDEEAIGA
jgi:branched-chain amino acid aminotransferase